MRAVGYVRVSTIKQEISPALQRKKIMAYADLHDFEIEIIEEHASAKDISSRDGASRMIESAIAGDGVGAIVVYKLDRLFRNTRDALEITGKLNDAGISLHSVTESIDTLSAMGRFGFTIAAAFGELERNLISERTTAALRHRKESGEVYGPIPYGWKRGPDKELVVDRGEAAVIKRVRIWRNNDELTLGQIADRLNSEKIPGKNGGKWHPSSVKNITGEGRHADLVKGGA